MRQLIESAMFERSRLQMDAISPERLPVTNQIVVLALKEKKKEKKKLFLFGSCPFFKPLMS